MDIATLIGLFGAMTVIMATILMGAKPAMFFNLPSIIVVFGGSFFVVAMKFSIKQLPNAIKVAIKAFSSKT